MMPVLPFWGWEECGVRKRAHSLNRDKVSDWCPGWETWISSTVVRYNVEQYMSFARGLPGYCKESRISAPTDIRWTFENFSPEFDASRFLEKVRRKIEVSLVLARNCIKCSCGFPWWKKSLWNVSSCIFTPEILSFFWLEGQEFLLVWYNIFMWEYKGTCDVRRPVGLRTIWAWSWEICNAKAFLF